MPFESNENKYSRFEEEEMYTFQEEENEEKKKHCHLEEEKKIYCHTKERRHLEHRHYEEVEEKKYSSFGEMEAEEEVSPPQYEMFDRNRFQWNAPLISLSESSENVVANLKPYSPMPIYAGNMFQ